MSRPPIDVLLPVWRARRTLPSAVGDILAQRDVDLRVIAVVDTDADGGDDGSRDWLIEQAHHEPRLLLVDGPGRGAGAALDAALERVTAPWVSHMEADDRCPPDRLVRLHAAFDANADLAAAVSRAGQFGARTEGMRRYLRWQNALLSHDDLHRERFVEIPALHQSGLYRADALRTVGGYTPRGPWPLDIDFWFRWFEHPLPITKLPRVLYRWRQHPRQSTRSSPLHDAASLRACKLDALRRLHGPGGVAPRPIVLLSTGATLDAWCAGLADAGLRLAGAHAWKPGQPLPELPPVPGPADDTGQPPAVPLILAAYGMARAREALRRALAQGPGRRTEPDELLFTA